MEKSEEMYKEEILDLYRNPHNFGKMGKKPTHSYSEENPLCGDQISIELEIQDDVVQNVKFSGDGCAISLASASLITDKIKLMKTKDIKNLGKKDILKLMRIPISAARIDCAMLPLNTIKKALK